MFEFHGWAVVIGAGMESGLGLDPVLNAALTEARNGFSIAEVAMPGNGMRVVYVHGLRNHARPAILHLFEAIARTAPGSYGLLYVRDQEDRRGAGYDDSFRVWRLAHGQLTEEADPFLSPCVPTIEHAYDPKSEN